VRRVLVVSWEVVVTEADAPSGVGIFLHDSERDARPCSWWISVHAGTRTKEIGQICARYRARVDGVFAGRDLAQDRAQHLRLLGVLSGAQTGGRAQATSSTASEPPPGDGMDDADDGAVAVPRHGA
jgi:hypothetical protein